MGNKIQHKTLETEFSSLSLYNLGVLYHSSTFIVDGNSSPDYLCDLFLWETNISRKCTCRNNKAKIVIIVISVSYKFLKLC